MTETPEQSASVGSMLTGFVIGAVAGAVASLFYAPKPGKELREDLMVRLDDLRERIDETAKAVAESTKEKLAEAKSDFNQAVGAGRAAAKTRAEELRRQAGIE